MQRFVIRGARGTMPTCGSNYLQYGGLTTCFTLQNGPDFTVFDAGTGIYTTCPEIVATGKSPSISLLFTHFHLDHISGLPSFAPLYNSSANIRIMGDPKRDWRGTLKNFMAKPYWPVRLNDVDAKMSMEDLPSDKTPLEVCGAKVSWFRIPHPQGCIAFRVETEDNSIIIATDVEYSPENIDPLFVEFCAKASYIIFDAHYTTDEISHHSGWGHSTWQTAAEVARRAEAGRLILTHHAPERTDAEVNAIVALARKAFPATDGAFPGMELKPGF